MAEIYEMQHSYDVWCVLEGMRSKLAANFGVTVTGNRCTLRWNMEGQLVQVHMIISDVRTLREAQQQRDINSRMEGLFKKYPELQDELFFIENGEYPV